MTWNAFALFQDCVDIGRLFHISRHLFMANVAKLVFLTFHKRLDREFAVAQMTGFTIIACHRRVHEFLSEVALFFLVTIHAGFGGEAFLHLLFRRACDEGGEYEKQQDEFQGMFFSV